VRVRRDPGAAIVPIVLSGRRLRVGFSGSTRLPPLTVPSAPPSREPMTSRRLL
jgi:hypothetical protein